jgi:anti-sigma regulatory factor (Ser/Thr protein kinase)
MCRFDARLFTAEVAETRAARRWVVRVLQRWDLGALCEELELAASELVTNALLHTRTGFDVTIAVSSGSVELAVRDRDPRPPVVRPPRLDLLSDIDSLPQEPESGDERQTSLHVGPSGSIAAGRGLLIVDAIADEWGVGSHAAGKDVWLRLPVPADWPHLSECPCDEFAARTPSGYPVRHLEGEWDAALQDEESATG